MRWTWDDCSAGNYIVPKIQMKQVPYWMASDSILLELFCTKWSSLYFLATTQISLNFLVDAWLRFNFKDVFQKCLFGDYNNCLRNCPWFPICCHSNWMVGASLCCVRILSVQQKFFLELFMKFFQHVTDLIHWSIWKQLSISKNKVQQ